MSLLSSIDRSVGEIREYWSEQARKLGADPTATTHDPLGKELELKALRAHLAPGVRTADVGCGNGYTLLSLSDHLGGDLLGVDYSQEMIEIARRAAAGHPARERVRFELGNVVEGLDAFGTFPQVYTDRCLINLPSFEMQMAAIRTLAAMVEPGGRLVLVESVQQAQLRLNALRESVGLAPIAYHWHNLYLDEDRLLANLPDSLELVEVDAFSSLYYLISRVFNAYLTEPGRQPDYLSEINKLSARLPSVGDFGPLKLFKFRKRAS